MNILSLKTENVKRISVVQITPDGHLVVIGGKNGQGKSSVLDSIMYALAGGDSLPTKPVRKGADKARVELDLGDLLVKRTFTAAGGTSLIVTNKDGVKYPTPQAMLDGLTGRLSFDPLEFAQQKPDKQSETLQALVGLDFQAKDAAIETVFNQRTILNRDVKALQARLVAAPEHKDVSGAEVSTADILAQQTKASEQNDSNRKARVESNAFKDAAIRTEGEAEREAKAINELDLEIERLTTKRNGHQAQLRELEDKVRLQREAWRTAQEKLKDLIDIDLAPFHQQARAAEETNRKLRDNQAKAALRAQFNAKQKEADQLTDQIDALEKEKRAAISSAKFPVPGLSLDDTRQVIFNGIPFDQASTAEQLRVSVSIGLALNKNLRILLIRRGSDLDPDSLALVADMAAKADAQVWLETSRTDAPVSVIMDDGHIQGEQPQAEQPQPAPAKEEAKLL